MPSSCFQVETWHATTIFLHPSAIRPCLYASSPRDESQCNCTQASRKPPLCLPSTFVVHQGPSHCCNANSPGVAPSAHAGYLLAVNMHHGCSLRVQHKPRARNKMFPNRIGHGTDQIKQLTTSSSRHLHQNCSTEVLFQYSLRPSTSRSLNSGNTFPLWQ